MSAYTVKIDPAAAITGRVELDLNSGAIQADKAGIDWGESAVKSYMAEQQYGETPSDFRVPNRVVTIPLALGMAIVNGTAAEEEAIEEAARRKLQQKVALLQRQGGVLLRRRAGSEPLRNAILNPSFEYNTPLEGPPLSWRTGASTFTTGGVGTQVRHGSELSPVAAWRGVNYMEVRTTGTKGEGAWTQVNGPFLPGATYTFSFYVRSEKAGQELAAAIGVAGDSTTGAGLVPGIAGWVRYSVSWTPSKEHATAEVAIFNNKNALGIFYVDGIMVTQGAEAVPYFDGDTEGFHWDGTPGDSVSENGAEPLFADIVNASLTVPDVWGQSGIEPGVVLKLECLPDFYGNEIALDPFEGTGQAIGVLQQESKPAVIPGDYPARARIALVEKGKQDQRAMLWGTRSTHYDAAPTAALFFDAKSLTPINGATEAADGATYSGKKILLKEPEKETWHPFLTTDLVSGAKPLTHTGSYRVWARCNTSPGPVRLRLAWSLDDATQPVNNAAVTVNNAAWQLVDLGEIRVDNAPLGENWWRGIIQANTGAGVSEVAIDRIWLQPVDDGAGRLGATAEPSSMLLGPKNLPTTQSIPAGAGTAWEAPAGPLTPGGVARVTLGAGANSREDLFTGFGFNLPVGVTVKGIEITSGFGVVGFLHSVLVRMFKAGAEAGTVKSIILSGGTSGQTLTAGGPTDLWGTTWTPAQINAANFGVSLMAVNTFNANSVIATIIYPVTIKVYYSYSATAVTQDAVLYSERKTEMRFDGSYREDTTSAAYIRVSQEIGDLPRLPPSGVEERPVELFVKNSRGNLNEFDPGIDKIQAQVFVRPCFLGRI